MKIIYDFFLKNETGSSFLKSKIDKALVFISILSFVLTTIFFVIIILTKPEDINLVYSIFIMISIPVVTLILLRKTGSKTAGNFFSSANVVAIASATVFFIYPPLPEINFVQGMYLMLGTLSVSMLFAGKRMLIFNAVIIFVTNFWYYFEITDKFGKIPIADIAFMNFPFAVILLTTVIYFGKKFFEDSLSLAQKQAEEANIQNLKSEKLLLSVKETSLILEQMSEELKKSTQNLNTSNANQAVNIEEITSAVEQMVNSVIQNSENAKQNSEIAENTTRLSGLSINSLMKVVEADKQISQKIEMVNEIAFRTNLLALNAAIEASHAGESGKGFSVVASEIKKLSQHSRNSASEIINLVSQTLAVSDEADKNLRTILSEIAKSAEYSILIYQALREQEQSIKLVNNAVLDVNKSAQNNASVSEKLSLSVNALVNQAEKLKKMLSE